MRAAQQCCTPTARAIAAAAPSPCAGRGGGHRCPRRSVGCGWSPQAWPWRTASWAGSGTTRYSGKQSTMLRSWRHACSAALGAADHTLLPAALLLLRVADSACLSMAPPVPRRCCARWRNLDEMWEVSLRPPVGPGLNAAAIGINDFSVAAEVPGFAFLLGTLYFIHPVSGWRPGPVGHRHMRWVAQRGCRTAHSPCGRCAQAGLSGAAKRWRVAGAACAAAGWHAPVRHRRPDGAARVAVEQRDAAVAGHPHLPRPLHRPLHDHRLGPGPRRRLGGVVHGARRLLERPRLGAEAVGPRRRRAPRRRARHRRALGRGALLGHCAQHADGILHAAPAHQRSGVGGEGKGGPHGHSAQRPALHACMGMRCLARRCRLTERLLLCSTPRGATCGRWLPPGLAMPLSWSGWAAARACWSGGQAVRSSSRPLTSTWAPMRRTDPRCFSAPRCRPCHPPTPC